MESAVGSRTLCSVLIWMAVNSPCLSGTVRHDRDDQLYLDLGATSEYDAVGMFGWTLSSGSAGLASGTLISDQWVLTAGHVVDDPGATNLEFTVGGEVYQATESVIHPDWTGDVSEAGDLALVKLNRPVTSVTAANLYLGNNEVEQTATIVGYGMTGTGLTGYYLDAGQKRAGDNLIGGLGEVIGYSSSSLMSDFDFPDPFATGKAISLDLEYLAAPGDSGGGWFIEENGQAYLVGVTSYGYSEDGMTDSDYGDIMGATRIGDYLSWITSIINPSIAGDFNSDGTVDGADFLLWQRRYSLTGTGIGADGNGDGVVNGADLTIWQTQLGQTGLVQTISSVPEPSTTAFMIISAILLLPFRIRNN